jgi:amino acid permease
MVAVAVSGMAYVNPRKLIPQTAKPTPYRMFVFLFILSILTVALIVYVTLLSLHAQLNRVGEQQLTD